MARPSAASLAVRSQGVGVPCGSKANLPRRKVLLDNETHSPSSSLSINSVNAELSSGT